MYGDETALIMLCLIFIFKKSDTHIADTGERLTAHDMVYRDVHRVIAVETECGNRLTYFSI